MRPRQHGLDEEGQIGQLVPGASLPLSLKRIALLIDRSLAEVRAMYADLARQVEDGFLSAPVEKIYPIEEIKTALAHAQRGERSGKILVAPNGAV